MKSQIRKILKEEVEDFREKHDRKILSYLIKQGFKRNSDYRKVIHFLDKNFGITGLEAFEMYQMLKDNFGNVESGGELMRKDVSKIRMRTANNSALDLVQSRIPFKGNNTDGKYENGSYVVSSYNWYPIKYSVSTSKQTSQLRPFREDIIMVGTDTLRKIISGRLKSKKS
jgi:hypothetical protein